MATSLFVLSFLHEYIKMDSEMIKNNVVRFMNIKSLIVALN